MRRGIDGWMVEVETFGCDLILRFWDDDCGTIFTSACY